MAVDVLVGLIREEMAWEADATKFPNSKTCWFSREYSNGASYSQAAKLV